MKSYCCRPFKPLWIAAALTFFLVLFTPLPAGSFTGGSPLSPGPGFAESPPLTVMQIIDNQFYKWLEYVNPEDSSLVVYLVEPENKKLDDGEIAALLKASKQWEGQYPAFKPYSPPEADSEVLSASEFSFEPSPLTVETVMESTLELNSMTDDRTPVSGSDAITYPYNAVGFLTTNFPSEFMRGTAFLISPYSALTNAHNVYAPGFGGWFESIEFSPGQYEASSLEPIKPYSKAGPARAEVNEKFLEFEDNDEREQAINHDYAAVFFDQPFSGISTFMPLQFNYIPDQVRLLGYPGYVRDSVTLGMWLSEGPLIKNDRYCLYYEAFTSGGSSGSPVFVYNEEAGTYRVIGVHSFASSNYFSGGPHFNDYNREIIESWLRWTPETDEAEEVPILSLNHSEATIIVNETLMLTVTITPKNGEIGELIWTTDHPAIATVDSSGLVTAIGTGKTMIYARTPDGREEAGCEVTVIPVGGDTETAPGPFAPGDINGDNRVDVQDVVLVSRHILQLADLDNEQLLLADVNGDGRVDIIDATLIMQVALGMIDSF